MLKKVTFQENAECCSVDINCNEKCPIDCSNDCSVQCCKETETTTIDPKEYAKLQHTNEEFAKTISKLRGEVAELTKKNKSVSTQINVLIQGCEVGQKKGSFTLTEASNLFNAIIELKKLLQ